MTLSTICGSDLHLYQYVLFSANSAKCSGSIPETERGDILGHEGVGVVQAVGDQVKSVKVGDRVVISAVIACGECKFCKM